MTDQHSGTLIALTGKAGSGKTTIAQELERRGFVRLRFAGTLKAMLRVLGLTAEQVDGDKKSEPCDLLGGKTPREAMQLLGTQWGRELIDEDLWVRATMREAASYLADGQDVVIDDCRFENEALAMHDFERGYVVGLTRKGEGIEGDHASERGLPSYMVDVHAYNNDITPEALVDFVLSELQSVESHKDQA